MTIQFSSADEMFAHYAAVKLRLRTAKPVALPPPAVKPYVPASPFVVAMQEVHGIVPLGARGETLRAWRARYRDVTDDMPAYLRVRKGRAAIVRALWEAGVTWREIASPSRKDRIAGPRQLVVWLIRQFHPQAGLQRTTEFVGRTDHTSAIFHINAVTTKLADGRIILHPRIARFFKG